MNHLLSITEVRQPVLWGMCLYFYKGRNHSWSFWSREVTCYILHHYGSSLAYLESDEHCNNRRESKCFWWHTPPHVIMPSNKNELHPILSCWDSNRKVASKTKYYSVAVPHYYWCPHYWWMWYTICPTVLYTSSWSMFAHLLDEYLFLVLWIMPNSMPLMISLLFYPHIC